MKYGLASKPDKTTVSLDVYKGSEKLHCKNLCMVRYCEHNDGFGTCKIENGLPYITYEDINSKEEKEKATTKCEKYIEDKSEE